MVTRGPKSGVPFCMETGSELFSKLQSIRAALPRVPEPYAESDTENRGLDLTVVHPAVGLPSLRMLSWLVRDARVGRGCVLLEDAILTRVLVSEIRESMAAIATSALLTCCLQGTELVSGSKAFISQYSTTFA